MSNLKPVVFLDRDGTINYDAGYINDPVNFVMYPYACQSVKMLNDAGYLVIIVTNQSGLARGFFNLDTMNKIHEKMISQFEAQKAHIDDIFYCPHDPNAKVEEYKAVCTCRKPESGLIDMALDKYPIDKSKMYIIGDKHSDMMAGYKKGCKTIMVKTGYGKGDLLNKSDKWEVQPDAVTENLLDAVRLILRHEI